MPPRALLQLFENNPRLFMALVALIACIPLFAPHVPPLVDLPGHMGRYAIQLDRGADPVMAQWYRFDWALIGNLGVDLLIEPVGRWLGVEAGVKLIVIAIIALTAIGMVAVSRQASGRMGPAVLFAVPLAYGYPFQFGFVNYALSMALALLAFALWMRMGASQRLAARAMLFVPLSLGVWLAHIGGWGALGLCALASEIVRLRAAGRPMLRAWIEAAVQCTVLALPAILTIALRAQGAEGSTGDWFNMAVKLQWFAMALADRWQTFDLLSVTLLVMLIIAVRLLKGVRFNPTLGLAALLLLAALICMPRILIGSAYADMRLAPFVLAMALLAIEHDDGEAGGVAPALMIASILFFLARIGAATWSFQLEDREMRANLAALDHVPRHARIVAMTGRSCAALWRLERPTHWPSLAIVRRHAFTNGQWQMAGAQLLSVTYQAGAPFRTDPSQIIMADTCDHTEWRTFTDAMALVPKDAFDFLWVINPPSPNRATFEGYTPVWHYARSTLYRIDRPKEPQPDAARQRPAS